MDWAGGRRLAGMAVLLAWLTSGAAAQASTYDAVVDQARRLAERPYAAPANDRIAEPFRALNYDRYQNIRFRPEAALWRDRPGFFQVQLFPAGFIFNTPVDIFLVTADEARPVTATAAWFNWDRSGLQPANDTPIPLAGFRLHFPLHKPGGEDEVAAFLGASYFRLIGREQVYGISARGLAIDTGLPRKEEFPVFRAFWLVAPPPDSRELTMFALLDSPRMSGAYRLTLRPGGTTSMDVVATLFAREDIELVGIAPLTSMYFTGENSRRRPADYRPEVHDSDGLLLRTSAGEQLWRPLDNPTDLNVSAFLDRDPRGFGLLQRDRNFDHYRDTQANYHRRPGLWVEPIGAWGAGEVRLIEIPTTAEKNDNIAAFWVRRDPVKRNQRLELSYRLLALGGDPPNGGRGLVLSTQIVPNHLPGFEAREPASRRVMVEFGGTDLAILRPEQPVSGVITLNGAKLLRSQVEQLAATGTWRLIFDFEPDGKEPVELRAFLKLYDEILTETWTYQWRR